jgi:hypothetical protein
MPLIPPSPTHFFSLLIASFPKLFSFVHGRDHHSAEIRKNPPIQSQLHCAAVCGSRGSGSIEVAVDPCAQMMSTVTVFGPLLDSSRGGERCALRYHGVASVPKMLSNMSLFSRLFHHCFQTPGFPNEFITQSPRRWRRWGRAKNPERRM